MKYSDWLTIGALLYGALYLIAVVTAGLVLGKHGVVVIGVFALGVSFLSYQFQLMWEDALVSQFAVFLSWGLSLLAGLFLMF